MISSDDNEAAGSTLNRKRMLPTFGLTHRHFDLGEPIPDPLIDTNCAARGCVEQLPSIQQM
jgi:hypothetical protein